MAVKTKLVVFDNQLVGKCTGLDTTTVKLLKYIISKVQRNKDNLQEKYRLSLEEVFRFLDRDPKKCRFRDIENCFKKLQTTQFKIIDGSRVKCFVWIPTYEYDYILDDGFTGDYSKKYITLTINGELQPYLQQLDGHIQRYTKYALKLIKGFKSAYSIVFLEYVVMKMTGDSSKVITISYKDLRRLLMIPDRLYVNNDNFILRVINPIINDMSQVYDIKRLPTQGTGDDKIYSFSVKKFKNKKYD